MKKYSYVQDWGTYCNDTLVCIGMSKKEIILKMRSLSNAKKILRMAEDFNKNLEDENHNLGWCYFFEGVSILWLPDFPREWRQYETLIHETHHLVHKILGKDRLMADEMEGLAYAQEYLFHNIRRKLEEVKRKFVPKRK